MTRDINDFDQLFEQATHLAKALARSYQEVTGEELDLEGVIRHYPLVAFGAAAGAGVLAGWWIGRRGRNQLPPPPSSVEGPSPGGLRDLASRLGRNRERPAEYLERLLPEGIEMVRRVLPEINPEEAAELATTWVDTVLQPKLKQGLQNVVANMPDTGMGAYLKQRLQHDDGGPEEMETPSSPPD
jgi:hypothetical protein